MVAMQDAVVLEIEPFDKVYTQPNVIVVDKIFVSFHQYLRYCHESGTTVFSIPGAIL